MVRVAFTGPTPRGAPQSFTSGLGAGLNELGEVFAQQRQAARLNPFFQGLAAQFVNQFGETGGITPEAAIASTGSPGPTVEAAQVLAQNTPTSIARTPLQRALGGLSQEQLVDLFTSRPEIFSDPEQLAQIFAGQKPTVLSADQIAVDPTGRIIASNTKGDRLVQMIGQLERSTGRRADVLRSSIRQQIGAADTNNIEESLKLAGLVPGTDEFQDAVVAIVLEKNGGTSEFERIIATFSPEKQAALRQARANELAGLNKNLGRPPSSEFERLLAELPDAQRSALTEARLKFLAGGTRQTEIFAIIDALNLSPDQARTVLEDLIEKKTTVVGRTPEDQAVQSAENKSRARAEGRTAADAAASASGRVSSIAEAGSLLQRAEQLGPGIAGLRSSLAESAGGILGQLNQTLGNFAAEAISGVSPADLTDFRTRARTFVAQQISVFTGEESGRFTEQERAIAEQASRLLTAEASFEQIRSALSTVIGLNFTSLDREAVVSGNPNGLYEIGNEEQETLFVQQLLALGLDSAAVLRVMDTIESQRNLRSLLR